MFLSPSFRTILLGLAAVGITACSASTAPTAPQVTVSPRVTPTPSVEPTPTEAIVHLSLWMPESLAPIGNGEAARILREQAAAFGARHADAAVSLIPKKDRGPGGLLDLLRAASPVAPAALPDVIVLNDDDLAIAAREGLIQPLDGLLDAESEANLFSFARNAARIDSKRMGLPFVSDFDHVVYIPERLASPPTRWTDLLTGTLPFNFSFADNGRVSDAVLASYQALDGALINDEGQPVLTLDALTRLLTLYRDAGAAGVVAAPQIDWDSPDTAWAAFRASGTPLAVARASRYLSTRADSIDLGFARLPSIDGQTVPPIGRSWHMALVTRDARRQALAIELITHLNQKDSLTAWTQAARIPPASSTVLTQWDPHGGYAAFVRGEMNRAVPPPSPAALDAVSPAFLTAIRDVLAGRSTPQVAAAAAVESVARGGK